MQVKADTRTEQVRIQKLVLAPMLVGAAVLGGAASIVLPSIATLWLLDLLLLMSLGALVWGLK